MEKEAIVQQTGFSILTLFDAVLARVLLIVSSLTLASNTLNALIKVVLSWSTLLGFLALCMILASVQAPTSSSSAMNQLHFATSRLLGRNNSGQISAFQGLTGYELTLFKLLLLVLELFLFLLFLFCRLLLSLALFLSLG